MKVFHLNQILNKDLPSPVWAAAIKSTEGLSKVEEQMKANLFTPLSLLSPPPPPALLPPPLPAAAAAVATASKYQNSRFWARPRDLSRHHALMLSALD